MLCRKSVEDNEKTPVSISEGTKELVRISEQRAKRLGMRCGVGWEVRKSTRADPFRLIRDDAKEVGAARRRPERQASYLKYIIHTLFNLSSEK